MALVELPPRVARRSRAIPAALLAAAVALVGAALLIALRGGGEPAAPPTLDDYWSGKAALVLDRKWTSTSLGAPEGGATAGAHVEVVGGTWYLFNRRREAAGCSRYGADFRQMATQVRRSTDRGATWGPPTTILAPTQGTPWACAATDGDAAYDSETGTWRYLFQCLGATSGWNGCVAERRDPSPLGPFTSPRPDPNPVITPGSLWGRICDDPGDDCLPPPGKRAIADEGTFDVFRGEGDGWWVGFHGYDGSRGFRGLARTTTFRRDGWQVDGEGGTPKDAVLDAGDAAGWRETWSAGGPVGAGAGSVLRQGEHYYQLAEIPDENLACTPGQSWDLGLFRTRDLASTSWQQLPAGNPIVYSSRAPEAGDRAPACNVQYPGLFEDPDTGITYLMHSRISADPQADGIYLYRLEWDRNLLRNGDVWTAETAGWQAFPGTSTQLEARRSTPGSLDGTPDLAFNCGVPACAENDGFFQDVAVPERLREPTVAFGGAFRAEAGAGRLDVKLHQLDAAGALLDSSSVPVEATGSYAPVRGSATIRDGARRLRFQVYARSPATFRADDLYVIPQDGCSGPRYPAC